MSADSTSPWEKCEVGGWDSKGYSNNSANPRSKFEWEDAVAGGLQSRFKDILPGFQKYRDERNEDGLLQYCLEKMRLYFHPTEAEFRAQIKHDALKAAFDALDPADKRTLLNVRLYKKKIALSDIHMLFQEHCTSYLKSFPGASIDQAIQAYSTEMVTARMRARIRSGNLIPYGPCELPGCVRKAPHLPHPAAHQQAEKCFYPEASSSRVPDRVTAILALWFLHQLFHQKISRALITIFQNLAQDKTQLINFIERLSHQPFCDYKEYNSENNDQNSADRVGAYSRQGQPFGLAFFNSEEGLNKCRFPPPLWAGLRAAAYCIQISWPQTLREQRVFAAKLEQVITPNVLEIPFEIEAFPNTRAHVPAEQIAKIERLTNTELRTPVLTILKEFLRHGFSLKSVDDIRMTYTSVLCQTETKGVNPRFSNMRPAALQYRDEDASTRIESRAVDELLGDDLAGVTASGVRSETNLLPEHFLPSQITDRHTAGDAEDIQLLTTDDNTIEHGELDDEQSAAEDVDDGQTPDFDLILEYLRRGATLKPGSTQHLYPASTTLECAAIGFTSLHAVLHLSDHSYEQNQWMEDMKRLITELRPIRVRWLFVNQIYWLAQGRGDKDYMGKDDYTIELETLLLGNMVAHGPMLWLDAISTQTASDWVKPFLTSYGIGYKTALTLLNPYKRTQGILGQPPLRWEHEWLFPDDFRRLANAFVELRAAILVEFFSQPLPKTKENHGDADMNNLLPNESRADYADGPLTGLDVNPEILLWCTRERRRTPAAWVNSLLTDLEMVCVQASNTANERIAQTRSPVFTPPNELYLNLAVAVKMLRWDIAEYRQPSIRDAGSEKALKATDRRYWHVAKIFHHGNHEMSSSEFLEHWFQKYGTVPAERRWQGAWRRSGAITGS